MKGHEVPSTTLKLDWSQYDVRLAYSALTLLNGDYPMEAVRDLAERIDPLARETEQVTLKLSWPDFIIEAVQATLAAAAVVLKSVETLARDTPGLDYTVICGAQQYLPRMAREIREYVAAREAAKGISG